MRKVTLSMEAQEKYEIIKRLAEGHITKTAAIVKIGCTPRHIARLLKRYQQEGKSAFLHGTDRLPCSSFQCCNLEGNYDLWTGKRTLAQEIYSPTEWHSIS